MRTITQSTTNKPILNTYSEVKIGKTIYRLTSKFEGSKDINDTLKRLAVKRIVKTDIK